MTTSRSVSREALLERVATVPRVPLAALPTPLEHCQRLGTELGIELYIKRDDMTGLAFGGNKTRQLEFLFAEIVAEGADVVVAGAATQSNWCRQISAAACKLNMDAHLVLMHGEKGPLRQGNLLLDEVLGATVEIVDVADIAHLSPLLHEKARALAAAGRKPFVVDPIGMEVLARSTVGYVNAAAELDAQLEARDIRPDHLYIAGANMTPAGMALGMRAIGNSVRISNIAPIQWEEDRPTDIARIANACAALLGLDVQISADEIHNDDGYISPGYGKVSQESREALLMAARTEGLILDPVYSSKAFAGLIGHCRQGIVRPGETVVFCHTGGTPALFAYAEDVMPAPHAAC